MDRKKLTDALTLALEGKGTRKFTQAMEFIVNFRNIDFGKAENRLNLDIILPKGKGKDTKVIVFADGQVALDAKNEGATQVVDAAGIAKFAADKPSLKRLAADCEFLAQPNLRVNVGKSLGQVLGARGKLPRPIVGNVKDAISQAKNRVRMASKGKYLPTGQCVIGSEAMSPSDLAENFEAVFDKVKAKATEPNIKSAYVKLSMGKPVKVL